MRRIFGKPAAAEVLLPRDPGTDENCIVDIAKDETAGGLLVGIATDCNKKYRRTMEDTHVAIAPYAGRPGFGFFGVYDGHAGGSCSKLCSLKLHGILASSLVAQSKDLPADACIGDGDTASALADSFAAFDAYAERQGIRNSGSTAVVALVCPPAGKTKARRLVVANVGDSRAVLCRAGKALRLSYDHKGNDEYEKKRIINAGGIVLNNRVNGVLAVSRSLGDLYMKDYVLNKPYTTETVLTPEDTHLIMACDGLWDVCTDAQAAQIVSESEDADSAATALLNYAFGRHCTDNITIMVISLTPTPEQSETEESTDLSDTALAALSVAE